MISLSFITDKRRWESGNWIMEKNRKIYLIGAGPGDPELLTLKALRAIQESDCILYDQLIDPRILEYARDTAELIYVGKRKGIHILPQEEINAMLVTMARNYDTVSRLKGGDPFIFGRGGEELEYLTRAGFHCEVIPGITAATGAAAAFQLPLTHRDYASEILFITGHKKKDDDYSDFSNLHLKNRTAVIYMGVTALSEMMDQIAANPENKDLPVAVIEKATDNQERMIRGTVSTISHISREEELEPPAIIIIGKVVSYLDQLEHLKLENIGLPGE